MWTALLLTLLSQADGGLPADAPVIYDVVRGDLQIRSDAGVVAVAVVEGCYLSTAECIRAGKEKAGRKAEVATLNAESPKWLGAAFGLGVFLGVVGGAVMGFTLAHQTPAQ